MGQNYGLGRGLSSLIPQKKINRDDNGTKAVSANKNLNGRIAPVGSTADDAEQKDFKQAVLEVDIDKVVANPFQPRAHFDEEKLTELSNSIKEHGILQPLVVTQKGENFELIAGERRLQAAKLAELKKIPIIIKQVEDKQKLELAIVENIQRHNLNPIEEAKSFQQLIEEFKMSQEEVAQKMGKSRSVVANKIRLLKLPIEAKKALNDGTISEGHAKVILSLENPEKQRGLLELIVKNNWTVRQAENKIKDISEKTHIRKITADPEIKELEDKLSAAMGTKVKVTKSGGEGGRVIIDYYSNEELNKLIASLSAEKKPAGEIAEDKKDEVEMEAVKVEDKPITMDDLEKEEKIIYDSKTAE